MSAPPPGRADLGMCGFVSMTVKIHDVWAADEQSEQMEAVSLLENVSMAGAAIAMSTATAGTYAG